jgi:hypothetical protein
MKGNNTIPNFQSTAHAALRDHYAFWNFWLTIGALIPTAALLCLVFVTDDFAQRALHVSADGLKILNAIVALFTFVCVLIQLVWKPDSREAAHAYAAEHFSGMLLRTLSHEGEDFHESGGKTHDLDVRGLPPIPDKSYLKLKQHHLQRIHISELLEVDPWIALPRQHRLVKTLNHMLSGQSPSSRRTPTCQDDLVPAPGENIT